MALAAVACLAANPDAPQGRDVVVYGATPGGISAAVAAARERSDVLVVEPTRHVGGLLASGLNTIEWNQNWDTFGGVTSASGARL